ncbi:MAG: VCBS repeat-containing protein [Planctomycetaceae bacterium]
MNRVDCAGDSQCGGLWRSRGPGWLATLVCLAGLASPVAADDTQPAINLGDYFGFGPLEVFKLEERSHSMVAGDFNSDGKTDLAIVDNSHSRIDILLQRDEADDKVQERVDVNFIESGWRFEQTKLPLDRQVNSMVAGDFNQDGKLDLAMFGDPDRLIVRYQDADGKWEQKWETRLADVSASTWSIATGDFNNDGRADLAVLGENDTYLLHQLEQGGFAPTVALRNTASDLRLGMSGDFDGDGRDDLFYTASDDGKSFVSVRLQTPQSTLGPEYRLDIENPLGVTVKDMLGNEQMEILAIDSQTERLSMYRVIRPAASDDPQSRPIQYGVGPKEGANRDLATGDLDGDGLIDVVVSDPATAQLVVYRQQAEGGLDLGNSYASFLDVQQIRISDITGDGRAEVVVFSPKEKTLGICSYEEDRLTFPRALPIVDEVLCFDIVDLNSDSVPEIAYIGKEKTGRSTSKFLLKALTIPPEGEPQPYVFGVDETHVELDIRDAKRLQSFDANADGRP